MKQTEFCLPIWYGSFEVIWDLSISVFSGHDHCFTQKSFKIITTYLYCFTDVTFLIYKKSLDPKRGQTISLFILLIGQRFHFSISVVATSSKPASQTFKNDNFGISAVELHWVASVLCFSPHWFVGQSSLVASSEAAFGLQRSQSAVGGWNSEL